MRGNFGLKLQNSPKLPRTDTPEFIVMQMSKVNREKGYYALFDVSWCQITSRSFTWVSGELQWVDAQGNLKLSNQTL